MAYISPTELDEALAALAVGRHCVIAGGTDVYPAMRQGKTPAAFLDVTRIAELRGITVKNDEFRFGAALPWSHVVAADLPPAFDALKQAAREVGSIQIQNAGTVAGNICNASPAADGVPPLLALKAEVELVSEARGMRRLPMSEFIQGVRQTLLAPDELVTAIIVPTPPEGMTSAFQKLGSRRYLVISICMTAVNLVIDDQRRIAEARIAVGACSAVAQRLKKLEADAIGKKPEEVIITKQHLAGLSPIDDVRGSSNYRLDALAEQCRRTILEAGQR